MTVDYDPFENFGADEREAFGLPPSSRRTAEDGATFVLGAEDEVPALWGEDGAVVLWADGEGLMIAGPQGVGKSTIAQQLILARLGLSAERLFNYGVRPMAEGERLFYLAMDRPRQIARSMKRMVTDEMKEVLRDRLVVWRGPLPFQVTKDTSALASFVEDHGATDVIADSYKDLAPGLSGDDVGSAINLAVQEVIARGVQWCGLHHTKKANSDNKRPDTLDDVYGSNWLTAGLGSVVLLWAKPGSPVVTVKHLKQPAEPMPEVTVGHDHRAGVSTVRDEDVELVDLLTKAGDRGVTHDEVALALFNSADRAEKAKARRRLDGLVRDDEVRHEPGQKGGPGGGGSPPRWFWKAGA